MEINGNTKGIKRIVLEKLENLEGYYDKHLLLDKEVLSVICEITDKINREICVFITRGGQLIAVNIGDSASVALDNLTTKRGDKRFTGIRCIHTHPSSSGRLSQLDTSALQSMRLDLMCAVGVLHGKPNDVEIAYINRDKVERFYFKHYAEIDNNIALKRINEYEKVSLSNDLYENAVNPKTAVLVNVSLSDGETEIDELRRLTETLGLTVVGMVVQKHSPDKVYYAGRGKLDEIKNLVQIKKAEFVIFNNQLSGSQLKNIEDIVGAKVIDRSMLILEIFARHATSNEGKLQVELAILKYTLPKLLGQGKALSRIGGGGGGGAATKGSGETKLETDRRHIRRTIYELTSKINALKKERDFRRERRLKSGIKTVAIVGYTNAGKSTLMNVLSKAGVAEADKLFATLDPVTRKVYVDLNKEYLLTDTVGFIDNLPHEFIDAFKSTLEEASYADLLLHVADCSSNDLKRQEKVVDEVLKSLGVTETPIVKVYNKQDINPNFICDQQNAVAISARTGFGIAELKELINKNLFV